MVMQLVSGDPNSNPEEARAYLPKLGEAERADFEELFAYVEAQNG